MRPSWRSTFTTRRRCESAAVLTSRGRSPKNRAMRRLLVLVALAGAAALGNTGVAAAAWCGNDEISTDRPDIVGGRKVHVVYAIPSDGADRFGEIAPLIASDLAAVTAWWKREDPSRAPRWDLFAFPGCEPGLGMLDLTFVRLARTAEAYAARSTRLSAIGADLGAGFSDLAKKYLVYYDGPIEPGRICGEASGGTRPELGGRFAIGAVYLQAAASGASCGALGVEGYVAVTAAHELLHTLGAVPAGAPNACPDDRAHICGNGNEAMAPGGSSPSLWDYLLDPGRDDYYGHSGAWWDVRSSRWLATDVPDRTLSVELERAAPEATVRSIETGIDCPRVCSLPWPDGDEVELDVYPGSGRRLIRWEGGCAGVDECRLLLDADKTVRAVFGPAFFRLALRVQGRGRIKSELLSTCRSRCSELMPADAAVLLKAVPDRGWRLAGWRGCTPKPRGTCRVKMSRARTVTVTFRRA